MTKIIIQINLVFTGLKQFQLSYWRVNRPSSGFDVQRLPRTPSVPTDYFMQDITL